MYKYRERLLTITFVLLDDDELFPLEVFINLFVLEGFMIPLEPILLFTVLVKFVEEGNVVLGLANDLFNLLFRAKLTVSPNAPRSIVYLNLTNN